LLLQANAQQRCDEVRDHIVGILKEQIFDIVQLLEAVLLHVKRPVALPGYRAISSHSLCKNTEISGKWCNFYLPRKKSCSLSAEKLPLSAFCERTA